MLGDHDAYLYDVTKPLQKVYNSLASYPVVVLSALSTFFNFIATLVALFGDPFSPVAASVHFLIVLIGLYLVCQAFDYNNRYYGEKLETYKLYLGLSKQDKKRYKKLMRSIHRANSYRDLLVEFDTINELFIAKQVPKSIGGGSYRDMVQKDLSSIREIRRIQANADKEIAKINREAGL